MKVVLAVLFCLVLSTAASAEIVDEWTQLTNIYLHGSINVNVGDADNPEYYPVQIQLSGDAISNDGGQRKVMEVLNLGVGSTAPFDDLNTIEGQKIWYQALPSIFKPVAKALREQADGTDVSQ